MCFWHCVCVCFNLQYFWMVCVYIVHVYVYIVILFQSKWIEFAGFIQTIRFCYLQNIISSISEGEMVKTRKMHSYVKCQDSHACVRYCSLCVMSAWGCCIFVSLWLDMDAQHGLWALSGVHKLSQAIFCWHMLKLAGWIPIICTIYQKQINHIMISHGVWALTQHYLD